MIDGKYLTLSEFARACGISRQAVHKNAKNELLDLKISGNKKYIDITGQNTKSYIESQNYNFDLSAVQDKKQKPPEIKKAVVHIAERNKEKQKQVSVIDEKKPEIEKESDVPDYLRDIIDAGEISFSDAMRLSKVDLEKIKIYESIKKTKIETEQKRNELISRKLIKQIFGKLYEIDMNQFVQLKAKLAPALMGLAGCTDSEILIKAEEKINDEIYLILNNVQAEIDKFLKMIE